MKSKKIKTFAATLFLAGSLFSGISQAAIHTIDLLILQKFSGEIKYSIALFMSDIQIEKMLNSITKKPSKEFDRRKALFNWAIARLKHSNSEFKNDLELLMETLGFYEKSGEEIVISQIYEDIAGLCILMGDLKRAVVYAKKSLDLRE